MTTHIFAKYIRGLLGLYLMIFAFTSCTYDYFLDENNFKLYVPQIKGGEISVLYVAIHDKATGRHVLTREIKAPFDTDENTQQGILRFKIPYGEYYVSCFADYPTPSAAPERVEHDNSYISAERTAIANQYRPGLGDTRMLISTATALPIGHPDAAIPLLLDMNDSTKFRGIVTVRFKSLPNIAGKIPDKIEIVYKGNATKIGFNGNMKRFTQQDNFTRQFQAAPNPTDQNRVTCSTYITPSEGAFFGWSPKPLQPVVTRSSTPAPLAAALTPIELEIHLYSGDSHLGAVTFGQEEFRHYQYSAAGEDVVMDVDPVTGDRVRADKLTLKPRQNITIDIDGLVVVGVKLMGWDDVTGGEITPI